MTTTTKTTEKHTQRKVITYARSKGFLAIKMDSQSLIGIPDYLFHSPKGFTFYIEFKSSTGKPKPHQIATIKLLIAKGLKVFIVNNYEDGQRIIDNSENLENLN